VNLLPSNQDTHNQELALFLAAQSRQDYSDLTVDPRTCAVTLLPHLAISEGVDISGLDESQSRKLIANAYEIHRYKGTAYAVERSLEPLYDDIAVIEWFEGDIPHGYFDINLSLQDMIYTQTLTYKALHLIRKSKRVSQHLYHVNIQHDPTPANVEIRAGAVGELDIKPDFTSRADVEMLAGAVGELDIKPMPIQTKSQITIQGGMKIEMIIEQKQPSSEAQINITGGLSWQL